MGPALVVPVDPATYFSPCFLEGPKIPQPNALFLQTPEKSFNHSVLFLRVERHEFLGQSVIPTHFPESPALEHKTVVAADHRFVPFTPQGSEVVQTGFLQSSLRFLRPAPGSEFIPDAAPVVAVHQRHQMSPPIFPAGDMGDVDGPSLVALFADAPTSPHPRLRCLCPVMYEPLLHLQDPVDRLAVDDFSFPIPQNRPYPPVAEGRMSLDQLPDPFGKFRVYGRTPPKVHFFLLFPGWQALLGTSNTSQILRSDASGIASLTRWTSSRRKGGRASSPPA